MPRIVLLFERGSHCYKYFVFIAGLMTHRRSSRTSLVLSGEVNESSLTAHQGCGVCKKTNFPDKVLHRQQITHTNHLLFPLAHVATTEKMSLRLTKMAQNELQH